MRGQILLVRWKSNRLHKDFNWDFFNFTSTTKHYDISKLRAYSWVQQTTLHGRISVWASSVWVPLKRTLNFTLTNLNSRNFLSTIPNYWVTSKQWPMQMKYPTIHLIYMAKILGNYIKNKTNCTLVINLFSVSHHIILTQKLTPFWFIFYSHLTLTCLSHSVE